MELNDEMLPGSHFGQSVFFSLHPLKPRPPQSFQQEVSHKHESDDKVPLKFVYINDIIFTREKKTHHVAER